MSGLSTTGIISFGLALVAGRDAMDRGSGKRNLSLARARYIYEYLNRKGISRRRKKYVGLKHKFPLGGDPKFDRRVEIEITFIKD